MSGTHGIARRLRRSGRLRSEAANCLAIAVREAEADTAALLIDEAVRLATRARELGESGDAQGARPQRNLQTPAIRQPVVGFDRPISANQQ